MKLKLTKILIFALLITCVLMLSACDIDNIIDGNGVSNDDNLKPSNGLEFNLNTDGETYSVVGIGKCSDEYIVIPDTYNNKPVTNVGAYAFFGCQSFTGVFIPNTVETIEECAFCGCESMTSVTIGKSVANIGERAFEKCSRMNDIYIIGLDTWFNMTRSSPFEDYNDRVIHLIDDNGDEITNLIIPENITILSDYDFALLKNIVTVNIPNTVTSISDYAFYGCSSIVSVNIPDSVTSIGNHAFDFCSSLIDVTIPDSVTSIGDQAFGYCTSLTNITIPDSVTKIGSFIFYNCSSLTNIILGDGITSISGSLFSECTSIESVIIGDGVTSIFGGAFHGCSSLTYISIPKSVQYIACGAFSNCTSLIKIDIDENNEYYKSTDEGLYTKDEKELIWYPNGKKDSVVTIPNGVTTIGDLAFSNCTSITNIFIPDSVTTIGNQAFDKCTSLKSIIIPSGVITVGYMAFSECKSLESLTISDGVTSIGDYAFDNCISLTSIIIPDSVKSIGYCAFNGCIALKNATIGRGLSELNGTFYNCYNLEHIYITNTDAWFRMTMVYSPFGVGCNPIVHLLDDSEEEIIHLVIPDGITSIPDYKIKHCTHLVTLTIPQSVTNISDGALNFYGLLKITNKSSVNFIFSNYSSIKVIENGNGNKTYKIEDDGTTYLETDDDFLFAVKNGEYTLIAYLGNDPDVTLPNDINGNNYDINNFYGGINVTIPDGVTYIDR